MPQFRPIVCCIRFLLEKIVYKCLTYAHNSVGGSMISRLELWTRSRLSNCQ